MLLALDLYVYILVVVLVKSRYGPGVAYPEREEVVGLDRIPWPRAISNLAPRLLLDSGGTLTTC